jgi:hypothetical protein
MVQSPPVRRVAIVGTGTIGASWATHYLARGFDVVATDPGPGAEGRLRAYVDAAWPAATTLGLSEGASPDRLQFVADLRAAVADADFVQENGPERLDLKVPLFADIDDATRRDTLIASSSSGITMSEIQTGCRYPERTLIGHPFNSPHIIPLVEVVGGKRTSTGTIEEAMTFYAAIGKRPVHLKKELPGHVANRFQAALYREVVYMIEQGVLDVAGADDAVSWGAGPPVGGHGSEPALAPRWGRGRHRALHGHPHGAVGGDVAGSRQPRDDRGPAAEDRRWRPRGGGRPHDRAARGDTRRDASRSRGGPRRARGAGSAAGGRGVGGR